MSPSVFYLPYFGNFFKKNPTSQSGLVELAWQSLTAFPGFWYGGGGMYGKEKGWWKKRRLWGGGLAFSDANEGTNGFPAFSLQSVSPLQHALLPGHCGRTKLQALDPITWNFSREAAIVYREAAKEGLSEGWGDRAEEKEGDLASNQGSGYIFSLSPSLLAFLLSFSSRLPSIPPPPYLCSPLHLSPLGWKAQGWDRSKA